MMQLLYIHLGIQHSSERLEALTELPIRMQNENPSGHLGWETLDDTIHEYPTRVYMPTPRMSLILHITMDTFT
jgi:hypothetical protein